jgi:glycosyltransferase involved in cell wall biosynthesis
MTVTDASVVHVLPDKLGGVFAIAQYLLQHRRADAGVHYAVLTDNRLDRDTRAGERLAADGERRVEHRLPVENLYSVLRRLARAIPAGPGVLVANDWLELAMLAAYPVDRTVVSVSHGDFDYYYDLAERHEPLIDCFVAYTRRIHRTLCERLPHRRDSIVHLPYGVAIPGAARRHAPNALRLCYAGRINRSKGIFDLPAIDRSLGDLGIDVTWTVAGAGPDRAALEALWHDPGRIRWTGPRSMAGVRALYPEHDVLVMPSRAEGLPVALLEAMAAGVVPVVSDLPSGIPEVVVPGENGYRPAIGDVPEFARAIARLAGDRERLQAMSRAARQTVIDRFDIRERAPEYHALYARWRELRRPGSAGAALGYGSRLDRPWLPNAAVYATRSVRRWLGGTTA